MSENKPYVIIRSKDAGVFAGELASKSDTEVTLINARRIYYWDGAATLSQLAVEGTSKPKQCRFPVETPEHTIKDWIEIIRVSEKARKSIQEVPVWQE